MRTVVTILRAAGNSGNVRTMYAESRADHELGISVRSL